ncbi:TPA: hypothetical protein L5U93_001061 [Pseudomonas aeruginosa]|nr:hypothetical protein [Pseudomonas aeruginosa]
MARTEINALLPEALQLSAYQWSSADQLKLALRQAHLNWLDQYFALEEGWLTGKSDSAHQHLFSYKAPERLHQWFQEQRTPQAGFEFKLHLITPDTHEIGPDSEGYYALVLEQMDEDHSACRRFYHLTEGGGSQALAEPDSSSAGVGDCPSPRCPYAPLAAGCGCPVSAEPP